MSERANPTVVGGFVVGALVLIVAGVLLFGSGALLREHVHVVAFFSGNVRGLQVGSAVEFRGVRVGTVTDIQIALDVESTELLIPVYMELDMQSLTVARVAAEADVARAFPFLDQLVKKGLRARLDLKSFVTGQLAVGLDMFPQTDAVLVGAVPGVYELPTVPSTLDRVAKILQDLPLQDIAIKLIDTFDHLARLLSDEHLANMLRDTASAAADSRRMMAELQARVGPLVTEAQTTLVETRNVLKELGDDADATLDSYRRLAARASGHLDAIATRLDQTLVDIAGIRTTLDERLAPVAGAAAETLNEAREAISGVDGVLAEDSRTRYNLDMALEELASAARSLRIMAEYLERNPDALIRGKNL